MSAPGVLPGTAGAATPRRLGRSIAAIGAGFVATAALSMGTDAVLHATGVFPPQGTRMSDPLFALALAYRAAATVAGGLVAARLAPYRPMAHAYVLAGLGAVAGLGGVAVSVSHPELGPLWYPIALVVTAVPCVLAGARLGLRRTPGADTEGA